MGQSPSILIEYFCIEPTPPSLRVHGRGQPEVRGGIPKMRAERASQCQQSRRARRAIDFSTTGHMRLACDQCARRRRNDDFSST